MKMNGLRHFNNEESLNQCKECARSRKMDHFLHIHRSNVDTEYDLFKIF